MGEHDISPIARDLVNSIIGNELHPDLEPFPLVMAFFANVEDMKNEVTSTRARVTRNKMNTLYEWINIFREYVDKMQIEYEYIHRAYSVEKPIKTKPRQHYWVKRHGGEFCRNCGYERVQHYNGGGYFYRRPGIKKVFNVAGKCAMSENPSLK